MPELKGSRTEANLMAAFAGESQARTKYGIYAEQARKDGYEQIAAIFQETSDNEALHASIWLQYLKGGSIPATLQNLGDCADGEHFEWTDMYKEYAQVAREEGFTEIAAKMDLIAKIEKDHEERYRKLIDNLGNGEVFQKGNVVVWKCRACGHIHVGNSAPQICPVCKRAQSFFEIKAENY